MNNIYGEGKEQIYISDSPYKTEKMRLPKQMHTKVQLFFSRKNKKFILWNTP